MTADELLRLPEKECCYELVRGELRTRPFLGARRSSMTAHIVASLFAFAKRGEVVGADCGFWVEHDPDTVRATDVAFIRPERIVRTDHFYPGAPDVAFEILDWGNEEAEKRAAEWLRVGTAAVVVVDAEAERAQILRPGRTEPMTEALAVDDIIPGWRMPLAEVFR
jgi:Uma2 family endonuclease